MASYADFRHGVPHRRPERVTCPRCGEIIARPNLRQHERSRRCADAREADSRLASGKGVGHAA